MRRILLITLLCCLCMTIPSLAQSGCQIELEDTILRLIEAQRAADQDEILIATSILASVQEEIDLITGSCDTIRLTEKYIATDGSVAFAYPDGWSIEILDNQTFVAVSSREIFELLENDLPETMEPGQAALAIQIDLLRGDTFDEFLDEFMDDFVGEFRQLGTINDEIVNGRRQMTVTLAINGNVSGKLGLVDYSDANEPAVALILGLGESNSLPVIEVYTDEFIKSIQYPPNESLRVPGVPLDSLSYSEAIVVRQLDDVSADASMVLSPDGSQVAYHGDGAICIYEISEEVEDCTPLPENFRGRAPLLQWSPDGRFVAFQEDALRMFIDADLWIFQVEDRMIINLTDDGDAEFGLGGFEQEIWLDTTMTWGPDNQIYLLRTSFQADDTIDDGVLELLSVDPETGSTTQVQDLTGQFELFSVFYQQGYSLDGVMSVSPDASQLAMSVIEREQDSPASGIWLIDLQGNGAPRQIASSSQFQSGYHPEVYKDDQFHIVNSLAWNADGSGLFVYANSPYSPLFLPMVYHLSIEESDVVPLIDLSQYTEDELFEDSTDNGLPPAVFMLRFPVLAPDFSGIIGTNGSNPFTVVLAIPFDGQPGEPRILFQSEETTFVGDASTVAHDGTIMLMGTLFRPD